MAETIESFVTKLQQQGVQAGQEQADQIKADAQKQARQILADAQAQADRIAQDAQKQAQQTLARAQTELQLAARDTIQRLRAALDAAMKQLLGVKVSEVLSDPKFVTSTLHELVLAYARSDIDRNDTILINVSADMQAKVAQWAMQELAAQAKDAHTSIDLKANLAQAGFEYTWAGATTEVTTESLVAVLADMVSPKLREVVLGAAQEARE